MTHTHTHTGTGTGIGIGTLTHIRTHPHLARHNFVQITVGRVVVVKILFLIKGIDDIDTLCLHRTKQTCRLTKTFTISP